METSDNKNLRVRNLAYLDLVWDGRGLRVTTYAKSSPGQISLIDTRVKTGEIILTRQYLYSVLAFIANLFKSGLYLRKRK